MTTGTIVLILQSVVAMSTIVVNTNLNKWEKIMSMQFEANVQSKISSISTNSDNIWEIDKKFPQFFDF